MKLVQAFLMTATVLCFSSSTCLAKPQGKNPPKLSTDTKFRTTLLPNVELPDVLNGKGRVDYENKKKVTSLKSHVKIPASAALGITDAATAGAAEIHIEWSREGAPVADCTLKFDASTDSSELAAQQFQFKLHLKNKGKRDVKGTCGATLPSLQKTDSVVVYKLTNGTERVDFFHAP